MHRRTDPRSPVQSARSRSCLPFVIAGLAALAFWGWRNSQAAFDWIESKPLEPAVSRQSPPADRVDQVPQSGAEATQVPTRARANLVQLFSADDYPMQAIRNDEQGTVRFKLTVSSHGRVTNCEIAESSGSRALDRQTCTILTSRARFEPARDSHGNRVGDRYTGRIRWELPEG